MSGAASPIAKGLFSAAEAGALAGAPVEAGAVVLLLHAGKTAKEEMSNVTKRDDLCMRGGWQKYAHKASVTNPKLTS